MSEAIANTISFEVKKDGLAQRQSGDWQLRFSVAALEMDQRLATAPMGSRFACVLVALTDEIPTDTREDWRDLGPTRQAGIRCKDPLFWAFLHEELHFPKVCDEDFAATLVREQCAVASRADLGKPAFAEARRLWQSLDNAFEAWKVKENG